MWNVHFSLPVRTSQPRVQPGICSFVMLNEEIDAGVIDRVAHDDRRRLHRVGQRVEPVARAALGVRQAFHQIDAALLAEALRPAARSSRRPRPDSRRRCPRSTRSSLPSVQYATPRWFHRALIVVVPGLVALRVVDPERVAPVFASIAAPIDVGVFRNRASADHQRRRLEVLDEGRLPSRQRFGSSFELRRRSSRELAQTSPPPGTVRLMNPSADFHAPRQPQRAEVVWRRSASSGEYFVLARSPPYARHSPRRRRPAGRGPARVRPRA